MWFPPPHNTYGNIFFFFCFIATIQSLPYATYYTYYLVMIGIKKTELKMNLCIVKLLNEIQISLDFQSLFSNKYNSLNFYIFEFLLHTHWYELQHSPSSIISTDLIHILINIKFMIFIIFTTLTQIHPIFICIMFLFQQKKNQQKLWKKNIFG